MSNLGLWVRFRLMGSFSLKPRETSWYALSSNLITLPFKTRYCKKNVLSYVKQTVFTPVLQCFIFRNWLFFQVAEIIVIDTVSTLMMRIILENRPERSLQSLSAKHTVTLMCLSTVRENCWYSWDYSGWGDVQDVQLTTHPHGQYFRGTHSLLGVIQWNLVTPSYLFCQLICCEQIPAIIWPRGNWSYLLAYWTLVPCTK